MEPFIPAKTPKRKARTAEQILHAAERLGSIRLRIQFSVLAPESDTTTRKHYAWLPGTDYTMEFGAVGEVWGFFKQLHNAITLILEKLKEKKADERKRSKVPNRRGRSAR